MHIESAFLCVLNMLSLCNSLFAADSHIGSDGAEFIQQTTVIVQSYGAHSSVSKKNM